jgi:hypothetical protein
MGSTFLQFGHFTQTQNSFPALGPPLAFRRAIGPLQAGQLGVVAAASVGLPPDRFVTTAAVSG